MAEFQDRLQNVNVASSDLLATPEEVKRRLPLTARAAETVLQARETVRAILERRDPRLFVVVGPCSIHDVDGGARVCRPSEGARRSGRADAAAHHAGVLREAAHHGRLEGADQRSGSRRFVSHREGDIARARAAAVRGGARAAGRHRGARSHHAAVSVRAHHLDGDRRAHHRIADAPRDGERLVDARRLQERHGRRARHLDQRAAVGAPSASFSRHHAAGPVRGVSHARQPARASSCCAAAADA